jgi:hypothetical protein
MREESMVKAGYSPPLRRNEVTGISSGNGTHLSFLFEDRVGDTGWEFGSPATGFAALQHLKHTTHHTQ